MMSGRRRKTTGALMLCAAAVYLLADYPNNDVLISWGTTGTRSSPRPCHYTDQCLVAAMSGRQETWVAVTEPPLTQMSRPPLVSHQSSVLNARRRLFKGHGRTTPAMHRQQWPPLALETERSGTLAMHLENLLRNATTSLGSLGVSVDSAPHSLMSCPPQTKLLIAVPSTPSNALKRYAIRSTWGQVALDATSWPNRALNGRVGLIFIVGQAEVAEERRTLQKEALQFHDILFTNISESYRNLTHKTLFVLDWFAKECSERTFFFKSDDDMFLNIPHLLDLVTSLDSSDVIVGHIHTSSIVLRSGPWSVPRSLYPHATFPPYAAGNSYIISGGVVPKLVAAARGRHILPVEDAYITGVLRSAINVTIIHRSGFAKWRSARPHPCDFLRDRVYTGTRVTTTYMRRIWEVLVQNGPCL